MERNISDLLIIQHRYHMKDWELDDRMRLYVVIVDYVGFLV